MWVSRVFGNFYRMWERTRKSWSRNKWVGDSTEGDWELFLFTTHNQWEHSGGIKADIWVGLINLTTRSNITWHHQADNNLMTNQKISQHRTTSVHKQIILGRYLVHVKMDLSGCLQAVHRATASLHYFAAGSASVWSFSVFSAAAEEEVSLSSAHRSETRCSHRLKTNYLTIGFCGRDMQSWRLTAACKVVFREKFKTLGLLLEGL